MVVVGEVGRAYPEDTAMGYASVDWRQGAVRRGNFDGKMPVVQIGLEKEDITERE
jgi:hypothetical protein